MDAISITQYITRTFDGVEVVVVDGGSFFFVAPERNFPFVTLVVKDDYDSFSQLSRPGVFRLNIGLTTATYLSLFASPASRAEASDQSESLIDFTVLDQLLPHPVYSKMHWVCILNPSEETFQNTVQPLLAEAYDMNVKKQTKRANR